METQTPHNLSALMHVHEQLLKTSARQQMSRYVDIKKLTDKDREIFVLRLAQVCPFTKSYVWKCVAKMEGFYDGCCEAAEVFQTYGRAANKVETQTPHSLSALMHVHEQLLKTSARQQMSRYVDIKKLTDKDREIFVLRLAQVCPLTKSPVWKCVAKMEGFYDECCEAAEVFQTYRRAADKVETQTPHSLSALMHVHEQLLKTSARQQMSRYVDIKKLTDKDREIFVLRLAQVCPLTKSHVWKCVAKMEGFYDGCCEAAEVFQTYRRAADLRWKHRHHIVPQHLCMCMNNS